MATGARTGFRGPAPTSPEGLDVVRVEGLNLKAMTRSARGTAAKPGRNLEQKAGLNGGILKFRRGLLAARLEQKAPVRGEKVNPAYTSQTCQACKHIAVQSRKIQATFVCGSCWHRPNADVNAARNRSQAQLESWPFMAARMSKEYL
jgi:transposase